jgi:ribosomal protein L37AE/L43A
MEQLTWKMYLEAKCPYCNESDYHTFYLNADTLTCNKCDKEFSIEIYAKDIEVRSTTLSN